MTTNTSKRARSLGFLASAALLSAGCASAQASPPSPAGDWHGVIRAGEREVRSAVHIEQTAPGVFTGDIDMPDRGLWDAPLEEVTFRDGVLTFAYRGGTRRFVGRWEPAAAAWVGQFHNPSGAHDVVYKPGFLGMPVLAGMDGYWEGVASMQGFRRRFILRVTTGAHGTYALLDLPDLVQTDVPVTPLTREGDRVAFAVPALGVRFEGTFSPGAQSFAGKLVAPQLDTPLEFVHNPRGAPRRTQTPAPPYPYAVEEVSLGHAGVRLSCTLTVPSSQGPHPAAVLLTGSGPQDRDETLVGHKPFRVLADHLARSGVAALRCDDRGVGRSTGEYRSATLEDFAGDASAAVDLLRARRDIAPEQIGLVGHSEGGIVAALAANSRPDVAFVVLMAGPGVPIHELLLTQGEEVARAEGVPDAVIAEQRPLRRAILEAMRTAADQGAARAAVEALLVSLGVPPGAARAQAAREVRPDLLRILNVDPGPALARLQAPVLALLGSMDTQVSPAQNLPALRQALSQHRDATIRELPGLNHLLQTAGTGAMGEYYDIEETIAPLALNAITNWLAPRGFGDGRRNGGEDDGRRAQ